MPAKAGIQSRPYGRAACPWIPAFAGMTVESATTQALEAEHELGDDVLLDLVRAAVDRALAPVEVVRRQPAGIIGPDRRLVGALALVVDREGVVADRLEQELGDRLLDLGAADLEDRGLGPRTLAGALGVDR